MRQAQTRSSMNTGANSIPMDDHDLAAMLLQDHFTATAALIAFMAIS